MVLAASPISHHVSMENPHKHYFQIETQVVLSKAMIEEGFAEVKMAVWTPGSYLIREYAKNVENVHAFSGKNELTISKILKNTWSVPIKGMKVGDKISVKYDVYAFEQSVRTSVLDDTHGYINPASVFFYVEEYKNQSIDLIIHPIKEFSKSSSALKEIAVHHFQAKNLDEFIDSPIEIGNHEIFGFDVAGVPHQVAFYGPAKVDRTQLSKDMQKVCETALEVFGEHPCDHYLFIIHNYERGGGGLEHLYSTTCEVSRANYENPKGYNGILNLLAHEYFHLWNVKRIRPEALGPINYEVENYTHNLWLNEGFTSYYANLITYRAGFITEAEFLEETASNISYVQSLPGNMVQPVAEASFDAWIKYYRPNENSRNSTISYYSKGEILGTYFNLWIMKNTNGKKNLDDLMQYLYKNIYLSKGRGFTDEELVNAFSTIAGKSANEFFEKSIYGLEWPDFKTLFEDFGFNFINKNEGNQNPYIGAYINNDLILSINRDSPAENAKLSVNDLIKNIDGKSWTDFNKELSNYKPSDMVIVNITRDGIERSFNLEIGSNPNFSYALEPIPSLKNKQEVLKKAWLTK
ncbi:MAG: hypothetical protein RIR51_1923 [Bacteroidota bacterium]